MPRREVPDETLQLDNDASRSSPKLPGDRRFSLVIVEGKNAGEEHAIDRWTIIIGRDASVADLVLDDPGASRSHACLEFVDNTFHIEDLESTNGISVNQKPVTRTTLRHGDRITIGKTTLQFIVEEQNASERVYKIPQV